MKKACGFSSTQLSGHTPIGIPASIRFVPVAPSKITGPCSLINPANSVFVILHSSLAVSFRSIYNNTADYFYVMRNNIIPYHTKKRK